MNKSLGANIVKLLSSKVAAQVIAFATAPIIARLFSPDDFGVRQIFMSIAGVVGVITCLRYELSIPLGKDGREASASFTLSLFFTLVFTLVVLALIPVVKGRMAHWFKSSELKTFLWLLPIALFIGGLANSLRYWAARESRFAAMAWSDFGSALSSRFIIIAWALIIGASAAGLFAGYFAGTISGILLLLLFLSRKLAFDVKNTHLSFEVLWTTAKRHKKFPVFSTWSGLLNTISTQLPPILLGLRFSKTTVGYYSFGNRLVSLPMVLLGTSIAQVFFPTGAKEYNETGTLCKIVSNVFKRLVQIGVFPMVALGFLGAPLFGFVFGEKWIEAGIYAQILSGYVMLQFVTSPLAVVFTILQRQGATLVYQIGLLFSRSLGIVLGIQVGEARTALASYSVLSAMAYISVLGWTFRATGVSLRWAAGVLLKHVLISCLLLFPMSCLAWLLDNPPVALMSLVLATALYVWLLYRLDSSVSNAVANIVARRFSFR